MRLDEYLAIIAVNEALTLSKGTEFVISELFRKSDWIIVPQPIKLQTGLRFFEELNKQNILNSQIKELGKNDEGVVVYKRV